MKRIIREFGWIMIVVVAFLALLVMYEIVSGAEVEPPHVVNSTAYCNPHGNLTASGKPTVPGITIAGKKEWIGCVAAIYTIREDGGIGDFLGYREFTDTGYGVPSEAYPGQGTIESGETIDIYMESEEECFAYGERRIYVQVIRGEG